MAVIKYLQTSKHLCNCSRERIFFTSSLIISWSYSPYSSHIHLFPFPPNFVSFFLFLLRPIHGTQIFFHMWLSTGEWLRYHNLRENWPFGKELFYATSENSLATVGISMGRLQKLKIWLSYDSTYHFWLYTQKNQSMFIIEIPVYPCLL